MKELGIDAPELVLICPVSNEQVIFSEETMQISVIENEAIWWHCPECGGWHIIVLGRDERC